MKRYLAAAMMDTMCSVGDPDCLKKATTELTEWKDNNTPVSEVDLRSVVSTFARARF